MLWHEDNNADDYDNGNNIIYKSNVELQSPKLWRTLKVSVFKINFCELQELIETELKLYIGCASCDIMIFRIKIQRDLNCCDLLLSNSVMLTFCMCWPERIQMQL